MITMLTPYSCRKEVVNLLLQLRKVAHSQGQQQHGQGTPMDPLEKEGAFSAKVNAKVALDAEVSPIPSSDTLGRSCQNQLNDRLACGHGVVHHGGVLADRITGLLHHHDGGRRRELECQGQGKRRGPEGGEAKGSLRMVAAHRQDER